MNKLMLTSVAAGSVILAFSTSAATRTWTGAVSDVWEEDGNWTDGDGAAGVPQEGDSVIIGSSAADVSVLLSSSTPKLASLEVGNLPRVYKAANLTVSGWNTCIQADEVVFGGKANVTCAGPSLTIEEMSRVWIKCINFTIKKESTTNQKGAINVTGKGYAAAGKVTSRGRGPGNAPLGGSGSHGGYGGLHSKMNSRYYTSADQYPASLPYDDPENPTDAGSSGCSSANSGVGHGGGVVRIEATGTVSVPGGSITANGANVAAYNTNNTDNPLSEGGGAGGTIYISCTKFIGSAGTLTANGGGGDKPYTEGTSPAGAGGCIAIHYDTALQPSAAVSDMTISAAPGNHIWRCSATEQQAAGKWYQHTLPLMSNDYYRTEADLGTLWFSDMTLPNTLQWCKLSGQICNLPTTLTVDSINLTSGYLRFPSDGFILNVTGDLTVSGTNARLEMGGATATHIYAKDKSWLCGQRATTLNVGGNMTIGAGARVDIRGAETNLIDTAGAYVTVAGQLKVEDGGVLVPQADLKTGGFPRFDVGSLQVDAGGRISASNHGFAGGGNPATGLGTNGYGPGAGRMAWTVTSSDGESFNGSWYLGASYGGLGGYCGVAGVTNVYGDAERPCWAGSGGGIYQAGSYGGRGGGCVYVVAKEGLVVDGTIEANGEAGYAATWDNLGSGCSAGSGGTIYLEGRTFSGADTGLLSACGGSPAETYRNSTPGGGGRIAVWTGVPYVPPVSRSRRHVQSTPWVTGSDGYAGSYTAAGGTSSYQQTIALDADAIQGKVGSVAFVNLDPVQGLMLLLK